MNITEKTINKNYIYHGKILKLRADDACLSDGKPCKREFVEVKDGACVLAVTDDDYVYLIEQFRYPYNQCIYEIPAGKIDTGETPLNCAARELKEETGITCDKLTALSYILPTPSYTTEKIYVFLAQGLTLGEQTLDEGEFVKLHKFKLQKALEMIMSGEITDAKTIVALTRYYSKLY